MVHVGTDGQKGGQNMDLIALAVPFFLLALLLEVGVDRWRGTGYYRLNDAINSLVQYRHTEHHHRLFHPFIAGADLGLGSSAPGVVQHRSRVV
ncbi:MAG: hypothetical protein U5K38_09515 [Woeseiaceae bacterium]|nr:hypothetical protein [Woeseiaceae bacterium]